MLRDLVRFQREARALVLRPDEKVSLGDWLAGRGYGEDFVLRHLIPMGAAIWSAEPARMREFPAATFARFFANHGLLSLTDRPRWRVVCGGSQQYVQRLVEPLRGRIRLRAAVRRVRRLPDGVEITARGQAPERFDEVILALHSDQALSILADPTPAERRVLSAIRYQENEAVLHTDARLLPRRRRAWASWNYRIPREGDGRAVVTYHMNRLQRLDAPVELCVTLNPEGRRVIQSFTYHHPIFDAPAIEAQQHRDEVSGVNRTHYCGAWWRHGFHEDGVDSALAVARRFGRTL
jgi:predicted NAD/FAD-binding protein